LKKTSLQIFKPSPFSSGLETFEKCKLDWEIDVKDLYAPAMNDPLILNDFSTLISTNFDQQKLLSKQNEDCAKLQQSIAEKDAAFQSMQEKMQKIISDQQETMQKLISYQQETIDRLLPTNPPVLNLTSQPNILPAVQVPNLFPAPVCSKCRNITVTNRFLSGKWKTRCTDCLNSGRDAKRKRVNPTEDS
jgi:hypothetical protein